MAAVELNSSSLISDANLQDYYRFEGNSNDSKGTNNGTDSNMSYSTGAGMFGQGASFNGTTSKITMPTGVGNFERTDSFTFHWWGKPATTGVQEVWSRLKNGSPYTGIQIEYYSTVDANHTGVIGISLISNNTSNRLTCYGGTGLNDGNWHMIDITYAGTSLATGLKIYIDGSLVTTNTDSSTLSASIAQTISGLVGTVSYGTGGNWMHGSIDDFAIFNRVLTATEISNLFNGSVAATTKTLAALGVG